jgi:hypothetical protein
MKVSCGSIALPKGFDPRSAKWSELQNSATCLGKISADPSVDNPFPDLRGILAFLALVPVSIVLLLKFARRRVPDPKADQPAGGSGYMQLAIWCTFMSVFPAFGLHAYGGVSHSWTVALKVVFMAAIIGAACGTVGLFVAKRWLAPVVMTGVLIGWIYLMRGLLMYA